MTDPEHGWGIFDTASGRLYIRALWLHEKDARIELDDLLGRLPPGSPWHSRLKLRRCRKSPQLPLHTHLPNRQSPRISDWGGTRKGRWAPRKEKE